MLRKKMPTTGKCSRQKAKRKAGGLRVQIYGKFRTYKQTKYNIRGVQL